MIEGIGSIVRYMGRNWVNECRAVPAVFGVNKDTKADTSCTQRTEEKKTFQQLLEEAMKENEK